MDSVSAPPKKKTKLSSSSGGGGGGSSTRNSSHHHHGHHHSHHHHHSHSGKDHSHSHHHPPPHLSGPTPPPSSSLPYITPSSHPGLPSRDDDPESDENNMSSHVVVPMIQVAKKIPPPHQNSPSQVPTETVSVADIDVDASKHFNIVPQVPVPRCERERPAPSGAKVQPTEDILGWDSQHAYIQRWVRMSKEERNGNVRFRVVRNDNKENLLHLLGLKNVFVKQLPNMPRPYVSRLVFDRKHESLALLKKQPDGHYIVMGGCCYRPFKDQKFGEIAFLAISHTEQVRGYGTRLMAQTKEQAKRIGLTHLLTCADNQAVPYFKKQGFSKRITLEKEKWQGYIKDYDGVTLMECILHANVDYLNIPMLLKAQKIALVEKMREISFSHVVYPGIDAKVRRNMSFDQIPGFKQLGKLGRKPQNTNAGDPNNQGSTAATTTTTSLTTSNSGLTAQQLQQQLGFASRDKATQDALHRHLQSVLKEIKNHDSAWPFLEPVDPEATGAYDYYEVIKNPMDLSTMQKQLDQGNFYVTKEIFIADLRRMVENCKTYNGKNQFTDMALQLEKVFMSKI